LAKHARNDRSERAGLIEQLGGLFVPVHRDGHKFIAITFGLAVVGFLVWSPIGWLFLAATLWCAYFFRDPPRVTPLREGLVLSAADGEIVGVETVAPPAELAMEGGDRVRVSVYLSPFDVHVNRAPVAGRIIRSVYVPGAFLNASLDKASEDNERRGLVIETSAGHEIAVLQIAGLVARRIVTFAGEGDTVGVGQRYGLIRFGSRVDVYLPPGTVAQVAVGQRAIAGETVLADLLSDESEREARRS
jgi:phosphatidylserine decarboxylase